MDQTFPPRPKRALAARLGGPLLALLAVPGAEAGIYDVGSTGTAESLEIKTKFYSTRGTDTHTWRLPGLSVSGPIHGHLEWGAGIGYALIGHRYEPDRHGWRDLSLSMKWRFLDHSAESGVTMAIEPEFSLPVGDESAGTGAGAVAFALPLRVSGKRGRVRVTGEVGVEHVFGRDEDAVGAGILIEYAMTRQWSVGIELVGDAPRTQLSASHVRSNIGFKWKPNPHFQLQGLVGRSLDNRRGEPVTNVGILFEYHL